MTLTLIAQEIAGTDGVEIVPAEPRRIWADAIPDGFANRCLPMLLANSVGWDVRTTHAYRVDHRQPGLLEFDWTDPRGRPLIGPSSHFGFGIVTWNVPWLFRTPPGWDLLILPSPNRPSPPGVLVLSGLVETDRACETFTLNWFCEPLMGFDLEPGDVIATLLPYPTDRLAGVVTELVQGEPPPQEYVEWSQSRLAFNRSERTAKEWQKGYWREAKRTRLRMPPFRGRS